MLMCLLLCLVKEDRPPKHSLSAGECVPSLLISFKFLSYFQLENSLQLVMLSYYTVLLVLKSGS